MEAVSSAETIIVTYHTTRCQSRRPHCKFTLTLESNQGNMFLLTVELAIFGLVSPA